MNLLLDTHVALWAITGSSRLPANARALINAVDTIVWVSAASVWEIAIKYALSRGDMPVSSHDAVRYFREAGYQFLAIQIEHAVAVEELPFFHHDPFDRLLVAQANVEGMQLLTHDPVVARYSKACVQI